MNRAFALFFALMLFFAAPSLYAFSAKTAPVSRKSFTLELEGYGTIRAFSSSDIVARHPGILTGLNILPGEKLQKGAVLFAILPQSSPAELLAQKAKLKEAGIALDFAGKEYERIKKLFSGHAAYAKEMQRVKKHYDTAEAVYQKAKSGLQLLTRPVACRAPQTGTAGKLYFRAGEFVKQGQAVLTIFSCRKLLVRSEIFDENNQLKSGLKAEILTQYGNRYTQVASVSATIEPDGAKEVFFFINQAQCRLQPGLFAKTKIIIKRMSSPAVPNESLLQAKGKTVVLVQTVKGIEQRVVRTGISQAGYTQVLSGLQEGEEVVTQGAYELLHKNIKQNMKILD
ncbi:nickel and cobalt resistance protein CnrB [bacterium BMS3Bbin14]|nr:nickel and cobalt resistance protein CnrB [bacterium BMS3Abin13]GBE52045.1 nickel and cobalt resistance protein CnrB [bacterium BMS3Bbin14]HDK44143.1 efflux RND transporter periplasmic adaptor subunit [Desulfobacteraceae bacterium]